MGRIIVFANRKGGCGKTTTAVNVAHGLAVEKSVLFIDMDAQAHASVMLCSGAPNTQLSSYTDSYLHIHQYGHQPHVKADNYSLDDQNSYVTESCIVQFLEQKLEINQVIEKTRIVNLSIIRSSRELGAWELTAGIKEESATALARQLAYKANQYDFIIIDTPPTLGILMIASLVAAQEVYIPMPMHFLAMEGLAEMMQIIYRLNAGLNPALRLGGIIPTFYNKNAKTTRKIKKEIQANFGHHILLPGIRNNVRLAESPAFRQTIFEYSPKSIGASDYKELVTMIQKVTV